MKTPPRRPAHMCACGWIHKLGSPTTCPLAAPTAAPLATATADSGNEQDRSETSVTLKGSYAYRKQQPSYRWSILKTQARHRGIPCNVPLMNSWPSFSYHATIVATAPPNCFEGWTAWITIEVTLRQMWFHVARCATT